MTIQELQDMISEQLGHQVSSLRSLEGHVGEVSGDFFDKDDYSYTGFATTIERSCTIKWTFKKFEDGWYFSSDPV